MNEMNESGQYVLVSGDPSFVQATHAHKCHINSSAVQLLGATS